MAIPLVNGTAYSWSQIKLNVLGREVFGIDSIKYSEKTSIENNYGAGSLPVSRGYGKSEFEASIALHMEEVEALQAAIPTGRLQDVPEFDVVVSFLPQNGKIVNHTLHNCRFKNNAREAKEGDMKIAVELELLPSHISWK